MLRTCLTELLKIDYPIIQAPIGSASCPKLASAVSNAGGLGMLALSWRSMDEVREVVRETKQMTTKPFGVNLVLEWDQRDRLRICLEEGVKIISLFWGDPTPYVQQIHDAGALVIHTVGSAEEARIAVNAGVDVIVAQGWEAGGHVWGKIASMPLLPNVVDAVSPVPVVAAGGISDGRGIVSALALGASGVWMGTRFLSSEEAFVHPIYREKLFSASESGTTYSCLFDKGWENAPHRTIANSTVKRWEKEGCHRSGQRTGEGEVIAMTPDGRKITRYEDFIPLPEMTGDLEALALYAGQSVGLVRKTQPAREIISELVEETYQVFDELKRLM
ncbi:nitronate monooxygenase [Alicyclobacillus tolerans]|uniref:NAD(P)H-dependent flavin oxidoreductase n=1 Tax=Alicyclobacillus tolerans TaxID=90970 RepID=UPI001F16E20F|nr:nitronate monooxygenase [Alicyclobacillus tolerans]MCF8564661.1 nitronate monooxygenase [Alicyclobacillus tolerans]